jgi:hypothetical protein
MGLGIGESIAIGLVLLAGVALFGRATLKKFFEMMFGAKKDFDDVKKQYEHTEPTK